MEGYVYLIRNGDLYNIGCSTNLNKSEEFYRPGILSAHLKTKEFESITKKLQFQYSDVRLPGSEYFRLSKSQVLECQLILKNESNNSFFKPIFRGSTFVLTLLFFWLLLSGLIIVFAVNPIFKNFLLI